MVSSQVGKGSCFTVRIPYSTSDHVSTCLPGKNAQVLSSEDSVSATDQISPYFKEMGMQAVLDPRGESPLILLAEDNQANIDTMSGYLESRGYRLMLANNGQQAIELSLAHRPDLIVMDIQMPIMDGLKAMHHIRGDQQLMHIPIIVLTALAMPGDRETCLAAGAKEYFTKPVKLKELATKIQQILEK